MLLSLQQTGRHSMCTRTNTNTNTYTHTHVHKHAHTCTHTHMHTHTRAHTHTHINIHTYTCACAHTHQWMPRGGGLGHPAPHTRTPGWRRRASGAAVGLLPVQQQGRHWSIDSPPPGRAGRAERTLGMRTEWVSAAGSRRATTSEWTASWVQCAHAHSRKRQGRHAPLSCVCLLPHHTLPSAQALPPAAKAGGRGKGVAKKSMGAAAWLRQGASSPPLISCYCATIADADTARGAHACDSSLGTWPARLLPPVPSCRRTAHPRCSG